MTLKIFERRGWVKVVDRRLVDDVLDAIAAAWTADRIARGEAEVITDPAQTEIALYVWLAPLSCMGRDSALASRCPLDLSISLNKLGDVEVQANNLARARDLFVLSVKVTEALAKSDLHSAQAQGDLSISLNKLGGVEMQARNLAPAREHFARSVTVAEALVKTAPHSAQAERNLSVSLNKLGEIEVQAGDLVRARDLFTRGLEIRDKLAKAPPHSAQAQRDLYVSLRELGDVEVQADNLARASELFARSLQVAEALAKADPHSAQAQSDLAIILERMATLEAPARCWLTRAVEIHAARHDQDPTNALVASDFACALVKLSNAQQPDVNAPSTMEILRTAAVIFAQLRRANALGEDVIDIANQLADAFPYAWAEELRRPLDRLPVGRYSSRVVAEEEVDEALDLTAEIATGVEEEVGERKRLADAPAELAASPPSWSRWRSSRAISTKR